MAEWLKAHAWKACVRETVPWVRIPLSPPACPRPCILRTRSSAIEPGNSSDLFSCAPDSRSVEPGYCSPKGPFLSEALDSIHSIRFLKFERLELFVDFGGKRFFRFSRTGESSRFQFAISRFESSRPSQMFRRLEILSTLTVAYVSNLDFGLCQVRVASLIALQLRSPRITALHRIRESRPSQKCLAANSPSSTVAETADTTTILIGFCATIDSADAAAGAGFAFDVLLVFCGLPFGASLRSHCIPRKMAGQAALQPDPDAFPVEVRPPICRHHDMLSDAKA